MSNTVNSPHAIAVALVGNPYGVGADNSYVDTNSSVVFCSETAYGRTQVTAYLSKHGIKKKDIATYTLPDLAYKYRYLAIIAAEKTTSVYDVLQQLKHGNNDKHGLFLRKIWIDEKSNFTSNEKLLLNEYIDLQLQLMDAKA